MKRTSQEYLSITSEELLIVEHGCIYPDKDECIGKHCKYHDQNPSFRDNVVCLLNEHDVADRVRSRPRSSQPVPESPMVHKDCDNCHVYIQKKEAAKAERERVLDAMREEILLCRYNISYPEIQDESADHLLKKIESLRGGEQR